ncbi:hypothetical protein [Chryseobacterium indoltheticum]|jgi:hypothetical protein|uniref:hypothetical protein n=1 Tax=Chryseobacterium indoltheticum TaxID=254 RepID=UPI00242FBAC1|nr:hypothetical protein [Chryseobacterium indoltheticum]MDF2831532.1 hypothetical protein [Chryseobacterium indoltheticum]
MKNLILIILCIISTLKSDSYDIKVLTKCVVDENLQIEVQNKTEKPIIFFYGISHSYFKIINEDNLESVGKTLSLSSEEDYLDFQFDHSEKLIQQVMDKYKISFQEAVIYLHNKKDFILIPPNKSRELNLPLLTTNYTASYSLDSTKSYYISLKTIFPTNYIPKFVKDSLEKKNISVIKADITEPKIRININKFLRKRNNLYIR